MLTSLAFIFIIGLAMSALCQRLGLPRIIGMLVTGIIIGPYALNLLDESILMISPDLREMALIIILIKAGLSLNIADLRKVGRPAILMCFVPASCEIIGYVLFAPILLGVPVIDAAIIGAVLAAVSPAVVVPRMARLIDEGYGTKEGIPQMIMAGASCDDIFVIVLFTTFTGMAQGESINAIDFLDIPVSIVLGVLIGIITGYSLSWFFEQSFKREHKIRNSTKVVIILGISFLLISIETWLEDMIPISGLLAVIAMASVIRMRMPEKVHRRLSQKFEKLWIAAEIMLFVLVGAAVDIRYTASAGMMAIIMILIALIFRSMGVFLCMAKTRIARKNRIFCAIAYLPKATVQAAIGSIPLSMGLTCGRIVLSVAVLGILITAPLGALGIDSGYTKLLNKE